MHVYFSIDIVVAKPTIISAYVTNNKVQPYFSNNWSSEDMHRNTTPLVDSNRATQSHGQTFVLILVSIVFLSHSFFPCATFP